MSWHKQRPGSHAQQDIHTNRKRVKLGVNTTHQGGEGQRKKEGKPAKS